MERSVLELKAVLRQYGWRRDSSVGLVRFEVWNNGVPRTDINFKEVVLSKQAFVSIQNFEETLTIMIKYAGKLK